MEIKRSSELSEEELKKKNMIEHFYGLIKHHLFMKNRDLNI